MAAQGQESAFELLVPFFFFFFFLAHYSSLLEDTELFGPGSVLALINSAGKYSFLAGWLHYDGGNEHSQFHDWIELVIIPLHDNSELVLGLYLCPSYAASQCGKSF